MKQRKAFREEECSSEGALTTVQKGKGHSIEGKKNFQPKKGRDKTFNSNVKDKNRRVKYPPCSHCKKIKDTENFCWFRPGV